MSNHDADYDIVAPAAGAMIESLRAYGYSPAAAIADIIDNSISAKAKNVWIEFYWSGEDSHILILDDGCGMDEPTLVSAMRPGSCSPLEERSPMDLGRFGMGLKTASFSQCRRLVVRSKKQGGGSCNRIWDINHVIDTNEWRLLKKISPSTEARLSALDELDSGTAVLWEDLDKMIGNHNETNSDDDQIRFYKIFEDVRSYLGMVFHVFLSGITPPLKIYANGNLLKPWDPFCETHPATTHFPVETITHPHGNTALRGFILPHKDRVDAEEFERNAGPGGWNARQGIYVYRNKRLLVPGGWLGLGRGKPWTQEEQYKLARIRVDITNSQDFDWLIDVKKSTARPPTWIKDRLTALAGDIRDRARQVFAHRGAYGPRQGTERVARIWLPRARNDRWSYKIDRNHHLIREINNTLILTQAHKKLFDSLLRILEETIPIARIYLAAAEKPDNYQIPFESSDEMEIRRMIEISHEILMKQGLTPSAAKQRLAEMEEYQDPRFKEYINDLEG